MENKQTRPIGEIITAMALPTPQPSTKEKDFIPNLGEIDNIELTEDEKAFVLKDALSTKKARARAVAYAKQLYAEPVYPVFKAEEFKTVMLNMARKEIPNFSLNDDNRHVFDLLCCYFTSDKRFEQANIQYSLNKGLLLYGNVGVGKTTLMRLFMANPKQTYLISSCRTVSADYSKDEPDPIIKYSANFKDIANRQKFGHEIVGICFDDLGTEAIPRKHFGNETNVMAEVILNRYDKVEPGMTHLTTNLTDTDICNIYGLRAADRIKEMFNIITYPDKSKSLRK